MTRGENSTRHIVLRESSALIGKPGLDNQRKPLAKSFLHINASFQDEYANKALPLPAITVARRARRGT